MLSRKKPAVGPGSGNTVSSAKDSKKKRKLPKLEDFLQMRDYTGAITLLEVMSVVILVLQSWCLNPFLLPGPSTLTCTNVACQGQGKGGWGFIGGWKCYLLLIHFVGGLISVDSECVSHKVVVYKWLTCWTRD